jgi:hypothetical protein
LTGQIDKEVPHLNRLQEFRLSNSQSQKAEWFVHYTGAPFKTADYYAYVTLALQFNCTFSREGNYCSIGCPQSAILELVNWLCACRLPGKTLPNTEEDHPRGSKRKRSGTEPDDTEGPTEEGPTDGPRSPTPQTPQKKQRLETGTLRAKPGGQQNPRGQDVDSMAACIFLFLVLLEFSRYLTLPARRPEADPGNRRQNVD